MLGIAFGLIVLAGLVATMMSQKTAVADGEALLAEWFELGPLPFGLEVEGATVEMRGEQVVLLTRPEAQEEDPAAERPPREDGDDDEDQEPDDDTYDWSKIETGPEGQAPFEVVVMGFPRGLAASQLEALFGFRAEGDRDEVEITDVGEDGGRVAMDRGRIDWGAYSTNYVHERELEWGGTFVDVVRVNLALPGKPRVVFVRWRRGQPASLERVREVLAALGPPPEAPPPATE